MKRDQNVQNHHQQSQLQEIAKLPLANDTKSYYIGYMITLKQAEQMTGIKADNLRQRLMRGTLRGKKIGSQWVISVRQIQKIYDRQRRLGVRKTAVL